MKPLNLLMRTLATNEDDDSHVEFDGDNASLFLRRDTWNTQGQPKTITVTIQPS